MSSGTSAMSPDTPYAAPPPGITPNFAHPVSNSYELYVTSGLCLVLIALATGLRISARLMRAIRYSSIRADVLFMSAVCLSITYIAILLVPVVPGYFGHHFYELKLGQLTKGALLYTYISEILYPLCLCLVKLALLTMLLEIFGRITWFRYSAYVGMALLTGFHVSAAIALAVMCGPRPRNGHSMMAYVAGFYSESCKSQFKLSTGQGVFNVISDSFILLLPIPAVWTLQMPLRTKAGVSAMFMTGSCGTVASSFGLYYRIKQMEPNADLSWIVISSWSSTIGELTAGIVIFCMPVIMVLLKKAKTKLPALHTVHSQESKQPMTETLRDSLTGNHRVTVWIEGGSQRSSLDLENQTGITKKTVFEVKVQA